jgi:hypothetical protein
MGVCSTAASGGHGSSARQRHFVPDRVTSECSGLINAASSAGTSISDPEGDDTRVVRAVTVSQMDGVCVSDASVSVLPKENALRIYAKKSLHIPHRLWIPVHGQ